MRSNGWMACLAAVAAVGLVACGDDAGSGGGSGSDSSPIKLGAVMTKSGTPFSFGAVGVEPMAKSVFDRVNAEGGIHGRKIEWIVADDANTPQGATQAARKLIQQDGVVALVGGASYVSCTANGKLFVQLKVKAIEGIASDNTCYSSPNIAATNPGPFVSTTLMLLYGAQKLGLERQCIIQNALPTTPFTEKALADFERISGKKLTYADLEVPTNASDFTPYLLKAKKEGCQSIFISGGPQQAPAVAGQLKAQGMTDTVLLSTGGSYDPSIAKALKKFGVEFYIPSEFEPFTETAGANADWVATAKAGKAPQNTFTQGAYLAATYMVDVLKGIDGEITRESVGKALETMQPIDNAMTGTPFVFGPGDTHASNRSVKVMKLENGAWVEADSEFLTLPAGS
jgi:branched-chain amino acid transport system substrate-binding protein